MATQRQIPMPERIHPCNCGAMPRAYIDLRQEKSGGGYFIECSPCESRTKKCPTLPQAINRWHAAMGTPQADKPILRLRTVGAAQ